MISEFYENLPAGTYLVRTDGYRIRLREDMQGTWAFCEKVRANGTRDRRSHGWSGSLRLDLWHTAVAPVVASSAPGGPPAGHIQTVAGGMGSTFMTSPAGRYRRECSCGFAGQWGSLNDALGEFCPEAGPACTCDLGGPRHNGDCPAHPDSMERNQPAPLATKDGR